MTTILPSSGQHVYICFTHGFKRRGDARLRETKCTISRVSGRVLDTTEHGLISYAYARQHPNDQDDPAVGRKLALTRALTSLTNKHDRSAIWEAYFKADYRERYEGASQHFLEWFNKIYADIINECGKVPTPKQSPSPHEERADRFCAAINDIAKLVMPSAQDPKTAKQSYDPGAVLRAVKKIVGERDLLAADQGRMNRELITRREASKSNYWHWQGDGTDHVESLTCPILIRADQMREILDMLREARNRLHIDLVHHGRLINGGLVKKISAFLGKHS
jgi:hypothetical protein